jgi:hypothetical protein
VESEWRQLSESPLQVIACLLKILSAIKHLKMRFLVNFTCVYIIGFQRIKNINRSKFSNKRNK